MVEHLTVVGEHEISSLERQVGGGGAGVGRGDRRKESRSREVVDRAVVGSAFGRETKGDRGVNIFIRAEEACSARTDAFPKASSPLGANSLSVRQSLSVAPVALCRCTIVHARAPTPGRQMVCYSCSGTWCANTHRVDLCDVMLNKACASLLTITAFSKVHVL